MDLNLIFLLSVEEVEPASRRVQRVQHLPEPRARVRLPQEFRDRREDQQDPVAEAKEPGAFPSFNQR